MIRHLKNSKTAEGKLEIQAQVRTTVEAILADILARGDAAVFEYSKKFDHWSPASFRLSAAEIEACVRALPSRAIEDIRFAQAQIRNFAQIQKDALRGQQRRLLRARREISDGRLGPHERGDGQGGRGQAGNRGRTAV